MTVIWQCSLCGLQTPGVIGSLDSLKDTQRIELSHECFHCCSPMTRQLTVDDIKSHAKTYTPIIPDRSLEQ